MSQKKRKKAVNGRNKGAKFERDIAKILSKWWGEEFHRTPASGGLHWQADNRVAGDIVAPVDSDFPFNVECKKQESWNMEQIIKGTGDVVSWWEQCINDAKRVDEIPLLIFSKNHSPIYYMTQAQTARKLGTLEKNYFLTTLFVENESYDVAIGYLDDLLEVDKDYVTNSLKS